MFVQKRKDQEGTVYHGAEIVKEVSSTGGLNVSSDSTFRTVTITTVLSAAAITVNSLKGNSAFRGVTTVTSGTSSKVVSASGVASGFPILLTGNTNVASDRLLRWSTNSVVDNTSFSIVGDTTVANDVEVHWFTIR